MRALYQGVFKPSDIVEPKIPNEFWERGIILGILEEYNIVSIRVIRAEETGRLTIISIDLNEIKKSSIQKKEKDS